MAARRRRSSSSRTRCHGDCGNGRGQDLAIHHADDLGRESADHLTVDRATRRSGACRISCLKRLDSSVSFSKGSPLHGDGDQSCCNQRHYLVIKSRTGEFYYHCAYTKFLNIHDRDLKTERIKSTSRLRDVLQARSQTGSKRSSLTSAMLSILGGLRSARSTTNLGSCVHSFLCVFPFLQHPRR